eukprot:8606128-Pyramimonas_sp.AAC.1
MTRHREIDHQQLKSWRQTNPSRSLARWSSTQWCHSKPRSSPGWHAWVYVQSRVRAIPAAWSHRA